MMYRQIAELQYEVVKLRAENARLMEELAKERERSETRGLALDAAVSSSCVLGAELAAAQLDAARYRWLRNPVCDIRSIIKYDDCKQVVYESFPSEERLDAAIDEAMKEEGK